MLNRDSPLKSPRRLRKKHPLALSGATMPSPWARTEQGRGLHAAGGAQGTLR